MAQPGDRNATPPGWYGDPTGVGRWRYWDGAAWTAHVSIPAPAVAPEIDRRLLRPHAALYALAPVVFAAGLAIAALLAVGVVRELAVPIVELHAPGAIRLHLHRHTGRTIYLQTRGSSLGRIRAADADPLRLRCSVSGPGGTPVKLSPASSSLKLTLTRDSYRAKLDFSTSRPGDYEVRCADRSDATRPLPLAVGPRIGSGRVIGGILGVFAAFFAGLALAAIVVIATAITRRRHRRRLEQAALGGQR